MDKRINTLALAAALAYGPTAAVAEEGGGTEVQQGAGDIDLEDRGPAIARLSKQIAERPRDARLYRWRGRECFQAGRIEASVADFDRCAKLDPAGEKSLWDRGISLYYAGEFDRGAKQFELYQTFHDSDVENAVWRYLCVARGEGAAKAQKTLLPITGDRRVPMTEIYDLYRGQAKPADVLAAARGGDPPKAALNQRLFYAHLYLGLFAEAAGDRKTAAEHLAAAAGPYRIDHYMGEVARVHHRLFYRKSTGPEPSAKKEDCD